MSPQQPISARALKRIRSLAVLGVVLAAAASLMLTNAFGVGEARSGKTTAVNPHLLLGISGNPGHFKAQTGQASLVDEAFLGWGQGVSYGLPFAALLPAFGPIPMIHLGTKSQTGHEAITPQGIASGAGDAYLIALNHAIAAWGKAIYVRPMAEMNNAANFYSAYETDGQARDASHSTANYRKAFARIYVILHGGLTSSVNARLRGLGLAPVPDGTELPANPFPMLRIIWSPLASSNPPDRRGTQPSSTTPARATSTSRAATSTTSSSRTPPPGPVSKPFLTTRAPTASRSRFRNGGCSASTIPRS